MRERIETVGLLVLLLLACESFDPPTGPRFIALSDCDPPTAPVAPTVLAQGAKRKTLISTITTPLYTVEAGQMVYIATAIRSPGIATPEPEVIDDRGIAFQLVERSAHSSTRRVSVYGAVAQVSGEGRTRFVFPEDYLYFDMLTTAFTAPPFVDTAVGFFPGNYKLGNSWTGPIPENPGRSVLGVYYVGENTTVYPGDGWQEISSHSGTTNMTLFLQWMASPPNPNTITWDEESHVGGSLAVALE